MSGEKCLAQYAYECDGEIITCCLPHPHPESDPKKRVWHASLDGRRWTDDAAGADSHVYRQAVRLEIEDARAMEADKPMPESKCLAEYGALHAEPYTCVLNLAIHRHFHKAADGTRWWDDYDDARSHEDMKRAIETMQGAAADPDKADPAYPPPPEHYQGKSLTPWEVWEAFKLDAWQANVIKYVLRAGKKGPALPDYEKARNYLDYLIDRERRRVG